MSTLPVILFPDAQQAVIGYLTTALPGYGSTATVVSKVPAARPATFVLVRRLGGVQRNVVTDEALLTVEAWATVEADAADLIQLCRALIHAMPGPQGSTVCYLITEIAGPGNLPDPDSDQARFTMTLQVALRGAEIEPVS